MEKFDVILADPPWTHKKGNVKRETWWGTTLEHYDCLSTPQICKLKYEGVPVADMASDNAALFLWGVWPMFQDALAVVSAWGFEYKTLAWVWIKTIKDNSRPRMGFGYYTRSVSEPCLLGIRGSMRPDDRGVLAYIQSPLRKHSQKPDEQYELIDRLYPNARKLELFARQRREEWRAVGDEIGGTMST